VKAGLSTSTVALRVVGGDEKGTQYLKTVFVYILFLEAVSSSDYAASNGRINNK
jgi:hypothetical protein